MHGENGRVGARARLSAMGTRTQESHWSNIGLYRGYIGITEKKMETTILGLLRDELLTRLTQGCS